MKFDTIEIIGEIAPVAGYDDSQTLSGTVIEQAVSGLVRERTISIGGELTQGRYSAWRATGAFTIQSVLIGVGLPSNTATMEMEIRCNGVVLNSSPIRVGPGVRKVDIPASALSNAPITQGCILSVHVTQTEGSKNHHHLSVQVMYTQ